MTIAGFIKKTDDLLHLDHIVKAYKRGNRQFVALQDMNLRLKVFWSDGQL